MAAQNTDKFIKVASNTGWQLDASGISDASVTSFGLVSATSLPTDTAVILTIDRVDSSGNKTPSKMERVVGVMSGTTVTSCVRGLEGTAQAHAAGAVVEVVISKSNINRLMEGILVEHNQDGTHNENMKENLLTWLRLPTTIIPINAPQGFLINGKIVPSVASNNLTVSIKTLAGNDPSASDPVYCRIGDTVRSITSALSVTKNAGTNWCNAGSAELATKEIDYFVYLGFNATDGVVIGFARIPDAKKYGDFSTTTTNEKYCAISTIANAASTDYYEVVGRFAATLSAGSGYTWSVPTFTPDNLIQRTIFETRELDFSAQFSSVGGMTFTPTNRIIEKYKITNSSLSISVSMIGTTSGSSHYDIVFSSPFSIPDPTEDGSGMTYVGSGWYLSGTFRRSSSSNIVCSPGTGVAWGVGTDRRFSARYSFNI